MKDAPNRDDIVAKSKEIKHQIEETINDALKIDVDDKPQRKKGDDISYSLVSIVNEFLDSFIIMGYDTNGDPHMMKYANTIQSQEALMSLLSKFYVHEVNNGIEISE